MKVCPKKKNLTMTGPEGLSSSGGPLHETQDLRLSEEVGQAPCGLQGIRIASAWLCGRYNGLQKDHTTLSPLPCSWQARKLAWVSMCVGSMASSLRRGSELPPVLERWKLAFQNSSRKRQHVECRSMANPHIQCRHWCFVNVNSSEISPERPRHLRRTPLDTFSGTVFHTCWRPSARRFEPPAQDWSSDSSACYVTVSALRVGSNGRSFRLECADQPDCWRHYNPCPRLATIISLFLEACRRSGVSSRILPRPVDTDILPWRGDQYCILAVGIVDAFVFVHTHHRQTFSVLQARSYSLDDCVGT